MSTQIQREDNGSNRPYVVNSGVLDIITKYIYTTPLAAFREGISNGYDQYEDLAKDKVIWVTIDNVRKVITWTDEATGILNMQDFTDVGNVSQAINKKLRGKIGKYHIGKMSFRYASKTKTVKIYSNNGESGDILTMLDRGWGEAEHFKKEHAHVALPHVGLKVEILDAKEELLKPRAIYKELSKWFGILISRGLKIFIKDENTDNDWVRVLKPNGLRTDNEVLHDKRLKMKSGTFITCRLEPINKPSHEDTLDVYVRHVFIRSIHSDYLVKGWINCDDLELNAGRDHFIQSQDSTYPEFIEILDKYLQSEGYDKQTKTPRTLKNMTEIEQISSMIFENLLDQFPDSDLDINGDPNKNPKVEGKPPGVDEEADLESEIGKRGEGNQTGTVNPTGTGGTQDPKETQLGKDKTRKRVHPQITYTTAHEGQNIASMVMNSGTVLTINEDRKGTFDLLMSTPAPKRLRVWLPYMVKAMITRIHKERNLSHETWEELYENALDSQWKIIGELEN